MLDKASKAATALKPAVGYLRRSTDKQEQSLDDQEAALTRHAVEQGFEILEFYRDDAISGTSADNRPAFQRLIRDASSGHAAFRHVLCYDVKRFSRGDVDEAGYYRHILKKHGVEVVYTSEGFSGTDSDDLIRPVKQFLARQESKDLSKVTIRGLLSSVESGSYHGGVPPYGYDYLYTDSLGKEIQVIRWNDCGEKEIHSPKGDLIRVAPQGERLIGSKQDRIRLVPSAADRVAVIRRIFQEYANGDGYRTIAGRLNAEKVPSPRTGAWSSQYTGSWGLSTIRTIICNQVYVGDSVWNRTTQGKFHRITPRGAVDRPRHQAGEMRPNAPEDWIVIPKTHEPLIPRSLFEAAQERRKERDLAGRFREKPRGRGKYSNYLLTGLITCGDCGHKFTGWSTKGRRFRNNPDAPRSYYYLCGGYVRKGNTVCKRVAYDREPLENYILGRLKDRLMVFLQEGGDKILRQYIADAIAECAVDPAQELAKVKAELAALKKDVDRLLDSLTPSNRDFVDEKLVGIRRRLRELEAQEEELSTVADGPLDVDASTTAAMAQITRFREVLEQGSIIQQKEFLRGMIEGITLNPSQHKGTVRYYDLLPASITCRGGSRPKLYRRIRHYGIPIQFGRPQGRA